MRLFTASCGLCVGACVSVVGGVTGCGDLGVVGRDCSLRREALGGARAHLLGGGSGPSWGSTLARGVWNSGLLS